MTSYSLTEQSCPRQRVLVIEDATNIARLVQRGLALEGYLADVAIDGRSALAAVRDKPPDLVVLDLSLPDIDGLEICRRIRAADEESDHPPLPILILTGRDGVVDRVAGLDAGADDYLVKPFAVDELIARVRALLRRSLAQSTVIGDGGLLTYGDLTIDTRARTARRGTRMLQLTAREFDLLVFLLKHPNQVMTQDMIMNRVWGEDFYGESNVLAVVIGSLRRELEAEGSSRLIQTIRGVGYVLREGDRRADLELSAAER
jgi:two-component system response regulator MprA